MIGILVFGLVALSAVCLWLLIEQRKSWRFLVWFIPVLLILSSSTYYTYTSILGYAKVAIPKRGMYLKHHIAEPNWIYLWVLEKNNVPIAYQIPYSKEKHNALEGVQKRAEEGAFMVIEESAIIVLLISCLIKRNKRENNKSYVCLKQCNYTCNMILCHLWNQN